MKRKWWQRFENWLMLFSARNALDFHLTVAGIAKLGTEYEANPFIRLVIENYKIALLFAPINLGSLLFVHYAWNTALKSKNQWFIKFCWLYLAALTLVGPCSWLLVLSRLEA